MFGFEKIAEIDSLDDLAPLLSTSRDELERILKYKTTLIAHAEMHKPNGDVRKLTRVVDDEYRNILRRLGQSLGSWYMLRRPKSVHGFVKGYSIITNAQQHTQKKVVVNVDVKNFFESINKEQIKKQFETLGFKPQVSEYLAEITTVDDVLATGFSTSPVLSNFICLVMDEDFEKLCEEKDVTYTRYADDITFSSNSYLPKKRNIAKKLNEFGFEINENKYRVYRKGGPQYVTGLTVVDSHPRLSKKFKRQMRMDAYYMKKYDTTGHLIRQSGHANLERHNYFSPLTAAVYNDYQLSGFISFIHSIEPKLAKYIAPLLLRRLDN